MNGFEFANPLIALGALGIAAPIIIHFLFRRKAKPIEFSAMRFVLLSYKKVARRLLVQEYLLLLARCLMIAALALALAIPAWTRLISGVHRGERPLAVEFILDDSLSMSRMQNGKSLLDSGKTVISDWLARLGPADRIGLMDGVKLEGGELTTDREKIKSALSGISLVYAPARLSAAAALAGDQLANFPDLDHMIIILTDLQRASFAEPRESKTELPPVYVIDLAHELTPHNLSVGNLNLKWTTTAREETAAITATIADSGREDARQALVRVVFGTETAAQGFVDVPADKSVDKTFQLTDLPAGPAKVRLEVDDGMTGDNAAYFNLKGGQEVRALVVDGDPGAGYLDSETYFLNQALNPRLYARSRIAPRIVTALELTSANLADYAVLVLCNVDKLSAEQVNRVKQFVSAGGGLLFTLGDRVDADAYDGMWGELLPRELRGVKLAYAGTQGAQAVRVMHLEVPPAGANSHPILGLFQDPAQGDIGLAGFWKYFLMQQEVVPKTQVLLRLTDGTPMMVEGTFGKGKVIVFASTIDRAWSDLCIHPTFLPLLQQTVQYLADAMLREDAGKLRAGSVVEVPVGSDVTGALVRSPDGKLETAELIAEENARRVRVTHTDLPGVYYLKFNRGQAAMTTFRPEQSDRQVVLNLDPAESDLTRVSADDIKAWIKASAVRVLSPNDPLDPEAPPVKVKKSYEAYLLWLLIGLAIFERALTRKG